MTLQGAPGDRRDAVRRASFRNDRSDTDASPESEYDSGEVEFLPDGSISIPVIEEELVVSKRRVVRERIIVRKDSQVVHERVDQELLKERIDITADGDASVSGDIAPAER